MKPTTNDINAALDSIEATERDENHPRSLARTAIRQFRLDREKGEKPLPVSNVHDDKGAKVLDVDRVVNSSLPNHARKQ